MIDTIEVAPELTEEEKIAAHEEGISRILELTRSIFSFEPLVDSKLKCASCFSPATFTERMKYDSDYKRHVCTQCREKHVKKLYAKWKRRAEGDTNKYVVTAQQARIKDYQKHGRLQPSVPEPVTA